MNAITLLNTAAALLANPKQATPEAMAKAAADIQSFIHDQPDRMTGLQVSLDDGLSWLPSSGVRLVFRDASENDDNMQDLLVNVTTEGIILDLIDQVEGTVDQTVSLPTDELVGMTI